MKEKQMTCAIFTKEKPILDYLNNLLSMFKSIKTVTTLHNSFETLELLTKHKVSVLFIDIEFIEMLNSMPKPEFIVGIGQQNKNKNLKKLLSQGFFDFLFAPVKEEDIFNIMGKILRIFRNYSDVKSDMGFFAEESPNIYNLVRQVSNGQKNTILITGNRRNEKYRINTEELLYLVSVDKRVQLVFSNGTTKVYMKSLTYFQKILPKHDFQRINKSTIINLRKITELNNEWKIFIGDEMFQVSRSYKREVGEKLKKQ